METPLEKLVRLTKQIEEQNKINAKLLEGPLKTIQALTVYVRSTNKASAIDSSGNPMRVSTNRAALKSLMRPPAVLTAIAFKHEN